MSNQKDQVMKITSTRSYTSKNGNKVFVYSVSGTKEELAKFKSAMGDNYRQAEDGTPLWFTTRSAGNSAELIITPNGKVIADMSAFDQAASLAKQYGGNLGDALAKAAVDQLLKGTSSSVASVTSPASTENLDKI